MRFTFQQSKIWESGNPIDPDTNKLTIKVPDNKDETTARRLLPRAETGRVWVLVESAGAGHDPRPVLPSLATKGVLTMLSDDQWSTIHRLVSWLDQQNGRSQQEIGLRLLKLSEENGEVAQAWIGYTGQNPRKGTTHTLDEVAEELVDVMVTAAVALTSITDKPDTFLDAKLAKIADRVNV